MTRLDEFMKLLTGHFDNRERFSEDCLEVSESMEMNGKRTFGYDDPIIYRRAK